MVPQQGQQGQEWERMLPAEEGWGLQVLGLLLPAVEEAPAHAEARQPVVSHPGPHKD